MKKLLITLLFTASAVSAYSQLPAGSISNKRGFFFELKGRDTIGAYTGKIKVDTLQLVSGQKLFRLTDTAAIYALLNGKIDSVSQSNDTLFFYRDNTGPLALKFIPDTPTLNSVLTKGYTDAIPYFVTSAQRLALSSPPQNTEVFDTDLRTKFIYIGNNWWAQ